MYIQAYNQYLTPVDGMSFWPDNGESSIILPPKPKSMPGRPRKKRIRATHEKDSSNRVSKAGVEMTCQNCGEKGHNKAGCKNEKVVKPPKPPAKKGRPKKTSVEEHPLVDVSDIPAFVNVADVEGSNAPEVVVENVGNVGGSNVRVSVEDNVAGVGSSVAETGGSSRDNVMQIRSESRPRKKRIRAMHEIISSNRVSKAGVEMTCQNCGEKGHNKEDCKNKKVVKPPKSRDRFRKKDVGGSSVAELGRTSADNVLQRMGEKRVKYTIKKGGVGRSKLIQMRGGACTKGGLGRKGFGRLGAWVGLDDGGLSTSNEIQNSYPAEEPKTQQSQAPSTPTTARVERAALATIASCPSQATSADQSRQERRARSEVPPVRPREKSQRILQKKLSKNIGGASSSRFNVQDVD